MKALSAIAEKIYDKLDEKGYGSIFVRKEAAGKIYVNEDIKKIVREKGCLMIEKMIMILFLTTVLGCLVILAGKTVLGEDNTLLRSGFGEGDKTYELEVSVDEGQHEKVNVRVTEQEARGQAISDILNMAEKRLLSSVLGDNPSLDMVSTSLNTVSDIEGTKVYVTWEPDEEGFFSKTGRLRITPSEPETVVVYATLHYFENTRRVPIEITVVPPGAKQETEQEEKIRVLQNAVREADSRDPSSDRVVLPAEAEGREFEWQEPTDTRPYAVVLLGLLLAGMVIPRARSAMKDEEKKRCEQMERDYPEIISKLILLLTAGMTCSGAWKRICSDYLTAKPHLGKRFAYEEMVCSLRELELGRSEAAVYERFGNRAGVLCYKRLAAMLSRNLRRGSREILSMLDLESREAYAARFEAVRKKGEETSTKLLLPMMGMLVIVIAITVVPAFMGMGI